MIEFSPMCLKRHQLKVGVSEVEPLVDSLHFDIMDGDFVPTSAFDVDYVDQYESTLPKHVHIMSYYPDSLLDKLSNITSLNFHAESKIDLAAFAKAIREKSISPGLVINPSTSIDSIRPIIPLFDRLVLMAVEPGYSGAQFIPETTNRLIELKLACNEDQKIIIDGGMNQNTVREVLSLGADSIVVCSVIVTSDDWSKAIDRLKYAGELGKKNWELLREK